MKSICIILSFVLGSVLIIYGVALIYPPAGVIALGLYLTGLAVFMVDEPTDEKD